MQKSELHIFVLREMILDIPYSQYTQFLFSYILIELI